MFPLKYKDYFVLDNTYFGSVSIICYGTFQVWRFTIFGRFQDPLKKEHVDYVKRLFPTQATGQHFNMPGHSLSNMTITILEQVKKYDDSYRQEREKLLIRKFNTFYQGLNRQP